MRRPAGAALPASSHRRRNARATRLLSSRGRPAGSGPSTVTTIPSPSSENRTSFHRSSASPRQSKPGPMLAVVAGTRTRQLEPGASAGGAHASSPYSVASGPAPSFRPLRHFHTAHTTITTSAATTA